MQRAASLESRPSTPTVAIKAASSVAMQRAASLESRESTPSVEIKTASSVGLVETESIGLRGTPSVAVRAASSVDLGQAESVELGGTPNVAVKAASSVELKKSESEEKDTPAFAIKAASSAGLKTEKSEEDVKEEPESLELKPVELSATKSEEIRHIPLSGARSEAFKPISPERKPIMHRSRSGMMLSPLGKRQSRSLSVSCSCLGSELLFLLLTGIFLIPQSCICVTVTPLQGHLFLLEMH